MRNSVTECNFDIMRICETFIDDYVADNEICMEGYTSVKKNRNRHDGEVILYIKEGIQLFYARVLWHCLIMQFFLTLEGLDQII